MSVNFSTITPMNPATISKAPTYTTAAASQEPAASNPILNHPRYQEPKKSHWFRNTLITLVAVAAATGLSRKYLPNTFNPAATLSGTEKWWQQGLHYAKLGVAKAGEFVNKYVGAAYNWVASKFASKPAGTP